MASCITDSSRPALEALGQVTADLSEDKVDQLLAARGMLADRLLMHGLQKRHLVDYGVNRYGSVSLSPPERNDIIQIILRFKRLTSQSDLGDLGINMSRCKYRPTGPQRRRSE